MENNNNYYSDIDRFLEKLYSPSEPERELAKKQLIEFGADAVAPLIDLLRDLASNRVPRFQTGEEQQGQAALEDYCSILETEGFRSPKLAAEVKLDRLAINYRLSTDIIYI